jgi:WD40 repeat protein
MKQQSIKPGVLALALVLLTVSSQAQSIYFNYTNGTNASYLLEDVRKITFDNDVMNLHFLDGTLYAWNVSTIGYYQYEESALGVEEVLGRGNAWQALVYPNPASDVLHIQYELPVQEEVTIALFDAQGKQVLQKTLGKQAAGEYLETLDVAHLPVGTYLCRISGRDSTISKRVVKQN